MADTTKESASPTVAKMLKDAIEARLCDVHTCMPATIDSYDDATGLAAVVPSLKRKYLAGDVVALPVIPNVPVLFPSGGGALLTFDLQRGDEVTLVFGERSLDKWKTTGGQVDPEDPRKFHLSDAYCFPGGHSAANPPSKATVTAAFTSLGLKISNATGHFQFKDNADVDFDTGTLQGTFGAGGKVKFKNALGELIATLSNIAADVIQLMTDIQGATTTTMLGPEPLVMPTFALDLTQLQTDKTTLDSFKA